MISTITSLFAGAQTSTRRITALKHILLPAILSFTLAAPYASAACGGKNLARGSAGMPNAIHAETLFAAPNEPGDHGPVTIVGLWNVTFTSGGQVVDVAFDAWHSDQTEVLNDFTPPAEGNVCLGAWEQTGAHTYRLKHPSWSFDADGNLLGTVVIGETVKVGADGNTFTGSYTYDIYDTSGNFLEEFTGTVKGTRIHP